MEARIDLLEFQDVGAGNWTLVPWRNHRHSLVLSCQKVLMQGYNTQIPASLEKKEIKTKDRIDQKVQIIMLGWGIVAFGGYV